MPLRKDYRLRRMNEGDLEMVLRWRNTDRIRANMFTDQVVAVEEHKAWFDKINRDPNTVYMIFEHQGRPKGLVNFVQIDRHNSKCSWGFYIGEEGTPRGTGTKMACLGLEYAFGVLDIRKLYAEIFAFNTISINLHKKLGFTEEACFKKHVLKNGEYQDVVIMTLFNTTWQKTKSVIESLCFGGD